MTIRFFCTCGKKLRAKSDSAGKRARCPACGRAVLIPEISQAAPPRPLPPSGAALWYYARSGQMFGPLSLGELKELATARQLESTDWVLAPGAGQWTTAGDAAELQLARSVNVPPRAVCLPEPPEAQTALPPIQTTLPPIQTALPAAPATAHSAEPGLLGVWFSSRRQALAEAQVVPDAARCVQCGICSHNCPMGIDVRAHARRGRPIHDSRCLTCSQCVERCPRGVLQFETLTWFDLES